MARLTTALTRVGGNTLLSRLLGFARDLVIARLFGADAGTDAFLVAFKIPNLFRRLFGEGAFASALVPVLHEAERRGGQAELRRLLDSLSGVMGATLLVLTVIGILTAPGLVLIFAPGFAGQPGHQALAVELLRLTLPYVALIVLAALAGAVLNLQERFGVPSFTPVLLNLAIIGCALWLAPRLEEPVLALGWGVLLGGLVQLGFQLPFLGRLGLLPRPCPWRRPHGPHRGTLQVLRRLGPVLFGVSVTQINLLIDTFLASFLAAGSISWLYYSDRLVEFPLGILGVALGTVILPRLSRQAAGEPGFRVGQTRGRPGRQGHSAERALGQAGPGPTGGPCVNASQGKDFSQTLDWALRLVMLLGLPATVGLVTLAEPLVATLFLSAEFGARDVRMASMSLMAYATGLGAFMVVKVLAPAYHARGDARTPACFGLVVLGVNLMLSLILMSPWGHAGLALGTSLAAWVNAGLLLWGLGRQGVYRPAAEWQGLLLKAGVGALVLGVFLSWSPPPIETWLRATGGERPLWLLAWMLGGAGFYFVTILAMGVRRCHFILASRDGTSPRRPPSHSEWLAR